jgi:chemotaxis protein methyltransferase CheR
VRDRDGIEFLQWALPRLRMRWPGFRKVRRQVCKRIQRRIDELRLPDVAGYRTYLQEHDGEWTVLDGLCRVSITRFYRDHALFAALQDEVLPGLARDCDGPELRCWCAGCAGGEEPYTLSIMWDRELAARWPDHRLSILATDTDPAQLARAREARYPPSALRELPAAWRERAFTLAAGVYTLRPEHRDPVTFELHDVRTPPPPGRFHLVLCRNLAFTYYDADLQREVLERLLECLAPGGCLVIGEREELRDAGDHLVRVEAARGIYRRRAPSDLNPHEAMW